MFKTFVSLLSGHASYVTIVLFNKTGTITEPARIQTCTGVVSRILTYWLQMLLGKSKYVTSVCVVHCIRNVRDKPVITPKTQTKCQKDSQEYLKSQF
jgi:tetrahydromethanopterin S-methyltransferase subunit D